MGGGSLLHILVTVVSIHSYIDPHIHSHAAEGLACKTTFVFFWGARVKGGQLQALKQSQHAAIGHSRSKEGLTHETTFWLALITSWLLLNYTMPETAFTITLASCIFCHRLEVVG